MQKPHKPQHIPPLRLQKLDQLPTYEIIAHCFKEAQKHVGKPVEQPFAIGKPVYTYALACHFETESSEPVWNLFLGEGGYRETRFTYPTRDIAIILKLVNKECAGESEKSSTMGPTANAAAISLTRLAPIGSNDPFSLPSKAYVEPAMNKPFVQGPGAAPVTETRRTEPFVKGPEPGSIGKLAEKPAERPVIPPPGASVWSGAKPVKGWGMPSKADLESSGSHKASQAAQATTQSSKRIATLEGNLTEMKTPNVLQSILIAKMTGVLNVSHLEDLVEVFFEEGNPVHAIARECKGEAAIMELLTWEDGHFAFYPNDTTTERTVQKRLQNLLMQSAPLTDQYRFITESGVNLEAQIIRKQAAISEQEFEARVAQGANVDLLKQKQFYQLIDNDSTLFDLLRKMPMPKVDWIPLLYNLVAGDLVTAVEKKKAPKPNPIEAMGLDRKVIESSFSGMIQPDTGLIAYPAIFYFLEQEYFRHQHNNSPFSIILFELRLRLPTGMEPLPAVAVQEAARRIATVKRNIDHLAHFETLSFLLLLPYTEVTGAVLVAKRICDLLWDSSQGGGLDSRNLALAFGVSGIPDDCKDLPTLINSAKDALNRSKQSGTPVVPFKKP